MKRVTRSLDTLTQIRVYALKGDVPVLRRAAAELLPVAERHLAMTRALRPQVDAR